MKKDNGDWFLMLNFYGWLICWFTTIWTPKFKIEFFSTGAFMLLLSILLVDSQKKL